MKRRNMITTLLAIAGIGVGIVQASSEHSLTYHYHSLDGKQVSLDPATTFTEVYLERKALNNSGQVVDAQNIASFPHGKIAEDPPTYYDLEPQGVTNEFRLFRENTDGGPPALLAGPITVIVPQDTPEIYLHVDYTQGEIEYEYRARHDSIDIKMGSSSSSNGLWTPVNVEHEPIKDLVSYASIKCDIDPDMIPQYVQLVIDDDAYQPINEANTWRKILSKQPEEDLYLGTPTVNAGMVTFSNGLCNTHGGYGYLMTSVDDMLTWEYTELSGGNPVSLPLTGPYTVDLDPNAEVQYFRIEANVSSVESPSYTYAAFSDTVSVPERSGDTNIEVDNDEITLIWNSDFDVAYRVLSRHSFVWDSTWYTNSGDITAESTLSRWSTNLPTVINHHYFRLQVKTGPNSDDYEDLDDVVGYVKTDMTVAEQFDIISVAPFGDGDNEIHIQDAIHNMGDLNASSTFANADKIQIWNGNYITYGLYDAGGGINYWMADGIGWSIPAFAAPADENLNRGDSVWYQTGTGGSSSDLIRCGKAYNDGVYNLILENGFNLISYPYSSTINLTDLVVSNATASTVLTNADQIITWDDVGYTTYGLYDAGGGTNYWMADGIGWRIPAFAAPTDEYIFLEEGFWYVSQGNKTVGFTQNYVLD